VDENTGGRYACGSSSCTNSAPCMCFPGHNTGISPGQKCNLGDDGAYICPSSSLAP
jgi:hypothetical protein